MATERARFGLGLAALGRPGYMTLDHAADLPDHTADGLERHAWGVLDAAYAGGVRDVDAARSYGIAEQLLGRWLTARGHGDVRVSSKWGYTYVAGLRAEAAVHEVKDHGLTNLTRQWPESRALLGAHLALYQIHSATLETGVLDDAGVLEALARLRDGVGDHADERGARPLTIGLSVTGPRQAEVVRRALDVVRGGRPLFGAVQATWNLLERSVGPALLEARARGLEVIVKEPLANGRLGPRGDVAPLLAEARVRGLGPDALALAAACAQPFASCVLLGAATTAQLTANLRARIVDDDAIATTLDRVVPEAAEAFWTRRAQLRWT
jgi:aryl-alcohol dehydrogenase-like predicted oxidoreductase